MVSDAARAVRLSRRRRFGRSEVTLLLFAAIALPVGASAWFVNTAALPGHDNSSDKASFAERFRPSSVAVRGLQAIDRSETAFQLKLRGAKTLLARQLRDEGWRASLSGEDAKAVAEDANPAAKDAKPVVADVNPVDANPAAEDAAPVQKAEIIPLPRSRPAQAAQADLAAMVASSQAYAEALPKADDRTVLQRLSDIFPGKMKMASLTPDSGLYGKGPDLASLGYDSHTAVYDISARAVYLPSGVAIEAHSGMGDLMDDPGHVNQRMLGATPPATYDLRPREALFHGIRALRMIPTAGSNALGRTGLLTHPYMLGPNGQSNGCVSIRFYERFLKAYDDGEINRLVVVPSLKGTPSVLQRASSES